MRALLLLLLLPVLLVAQVQSVTFTGLGAASLLQKDVVKVSAVAGIGGMVTVNAALHGGFSLLVSAGYQDLLVTQDEFAMFAEWNWRSWKRYFGDITDRNFANATQWVQTVLKDSNYSAAFTPTQRMDVMPILLEAAYTAEVSRITLQARAGAGVLFYARRLYVTEAWSKKFRSVGYTYEYSYRNMAEPRYGNPLAVSAGLNSAWQLSEYFSITGEIRWLYILNTGQRFNYYSFPARGLLNVGFGAAFLY